MVARVELDAARDEVLLILPRDQISSTLRGYEPLNRFTVGLAIEQAIVDFGIEKYLYYGYAAVMREALNDRL